ncbi:MAG: methionyl-tRNA formyltransferase [Rhodospirillaceae bacterium]
MTALNLIYMGSPDFSIPALKSLIQAGHKILCVYAQPPRPAGRGQAERPCPVHAFAAGQGIPVRTPVNFKDAADRAAFADLNADAAVVAAYGLILPKDVLGAPRMGCLNIHASLLPRWRGAAPIQRAIQAGDAETGVTIMQMDEGLDTGAMLMTGRVPIGLQKTAGDLHKELASLGAKLIVMALQGLVEETVFPTPQPDAGVTYAAKFQRDEGRLDWSKSAVDLERTVRAFTPRPGTWFDYEGERIKVLAAAAVDTGGGKAPGTVADGLGTVACKDGALRPLRLQRAGKAALDADAFFRGFDLPPGAVLS